MINRYCVDCGTKLAGHGKPKRCRWCARKCTWTHKARVNASRSARKRYEDPRQKKLTAERTRLAWRNPEIRAKMEKAIIDACVGGKHQTKETRKKMSVSAKRAMTLERRVTISAQQKKRWNDSVYRENYSSKIRAAWKNGSYDDRDSIEYRNKLSIAMKQAHANGKFDSVTRDDYFVSSLERMAWEFLESLGIEFEKQYRPLRCSYVYDIYFADSILLLEIDGDYWHHSENAVKYGMVERDRLKSEWAYDNGFDLARVREGDIKSLGVGPALANVLPEEVFGDSWQKEGF